MASTRECIVHDITQYDDAIRENELYIDEINKMLVDNDALTPEEVTELRTQLDDLLYENNELWKDIAMLEELLHRIDFSHIRHYSPYEERYDPYDEVLTGGDY